MRTMEESIEKKAQERADRKLQDIIGRYGDANGERRKPYYREQLIQGGIYAVVPESCQHGAAELPGIQ